MRTAAWDTALCIVLGNCSKEAGRKVIVLVKGEYMQSYWCIYIALVKGRIQAIKHIFFQKVSVSLMKLC